MRSRHGWTLLAVLCLLALPAASRQGQLSGRRHTTPVQAPAQPGQPVPAQPNPPAANPPAPAQPGAPAEGEKGPDAAKPPAEAPPPEGTPPEAAKLPEKPAALQRLQVVAQGVPNLEKLIADIEAEARRMLPLFGADLFINDTAALYETLLGQPQGAAPAVVALRPATAVPISPLVPPQPEPPALPGQPLAPGQPIPPVPPPAALPGQAVPGLPGTPAAPANRVVFNPPPGYELQPGDQVEITFWNRYLAPQTVAATVNPDGTISFDPVGSLRVAGLNVVAFRDLVTTELRRRGPREAQVRILFVGLHDLRIRVTGAVRQPSASLVLTGYATLVDGIAAAGGPGAYASLRTIRLYREGKMQTLDLYGYLLRGDPALNPALRDGDSIHVPDAQALVAVDGEVQRPARYELREERSVQQVVAMAGGPTGRAAQVQVLRVNAAGRQTRQEWGLADALAGKADVEALKHGDAIRLLPLGRVADTVIIAGAVGLEGEYGYRPGMTLGDLVQQAQGVLRSGSAALGMIRRAGADGQVQGLNFEVAQLLDGGPASRIVLHPGDRVEVPNVEQQPDIEVTVTGAVKQPGTYVMQAAQTLADVLGEAHGLATGAAPKARVLSTAGGQPVEIVCDLTPLARGGKPEPNPVLANGDQITIALLSETGGMASVSIAGLVRKPGEYPLTQGQRVADLIDLGGGLLPRSGRRAKLVREKPGTTETEVVYIDITKALQGDPLANVALQVNDKLEVQQLIPDNVSVEVLGSVKSPGMFECAAGMRVSDLLTECGGVLHEGGLRATLYRPVPGSEQVQVVYVDLDKALAGDPVANIEIRPHDRLEVRTFVPTVKTVAVVGAVEKPGSFPRREGMRVSDLIDEAGGLTPRADRQTAFLTRAMPNGRSQLYRVDLDRATQHDPDQDLLLADEDSLEVVNVRELRGHEPSAKVDGAVYRPGPYPLADGMTVGDLIYRAGLLPDAYLPRAEVRRLLPDGGARVIPLDLSLQPVSFPLADGDTLHVYKHNEAVFREPNVKIWGDVQRQGDYERSDGLTLKDLLFMAGGAMRDPDFLVCEVSRGRGSQAVVLRPDFRALVAGDATQNLLLEDGDVVYVRTFGDVVDRPGQVLVDGEVTIPGHYSLSAEGDSLRHLLTERAHGLTKRAFPEGAVLLRRVDRIVGSAQATNANEIFKSLVLERKQDDFALLLSRGADPAFTDKMPSTTRTLASEAVSPSFAGSPDEDLDMAGIAGYLDRVQGTQSAGAADLPARLRSYVRVAIDLPRVLSNEANDVLLEGGDIIFIPDKPAVVLVEGAVPKDTPLPFMPGRRVGDYIAEAGGLTSRADARGILLVRANGTVRAAGMKTEVMLGDLVLVPPKALEVPEPRSARLQQLQVLGSLLGGLATAILAISNVVK